MARTLVILALASAVLALLPLASATTYQVHADCNSSVNYCRLDGAFSIQTDGPGTASITAGGSSCHQLQFTLRIDRHDGHGTGWLSPGQTDGPFTLDLPAGSHTGGFGVYSGDCDGAFGTNHWDATFTYNGAAPPAPLPELGSLSLAGAGLVAVAGVFVLGRRSR